MITIYELVGACIISGILGYAISQLVWVCPDKRYWQRVYRLMNESGWRRKR